MPALTNGLAGDLSWNNFWILSRHVTAFVWSDPGLQISRTDSSRFLKSKNQGCVPSLSEDKGSGITKGIEGSLSTS